MNSSFVGIDPGKGGSLCLLKKDSSVRFFDWPKDGNLILYFQKIASVLSANSVKLCVLERVHAMPKQGVSSTFSFGVNYGIWQGFLISIGTPYCLVPPQTWMKNLTSKADGVDTKKRVGNVAIRMFPNAELTGPKGGFKDGRADALMMAYYAMLQSPSGGILSPSLGTKKRRS